MRLKPFHSAATITFNIRKQAKAALALGPVCIEPIIRLHCKQWEPIDARKNRRDVDGHRPSRKYQPRIHSLQRSIIERGL